MTVPFHRANLKPSGIDWDRPQNFAERLRQSIEYLTFRTHNFNALAACQTIQKFVSEQQKYLLYQKYFPLEWENSRASFFKAGYYENYTERSNEFFALVHEHLFPLLSGWNEDPETDFDTFNIFSLNVDFCCEDIEYEYLQVSYVMALLFFSYDEDLWEFLLHNYQIRKEDFPEINRYAADDLWQHKRVGNAEFYLNIIEVIDHSTGNPWLDSTNCHHLAEFSWSEEVVETLSKSFRQANEILEKTEILDSLIVADPKKILLEMIELWNTGKLS